MDLDIYMLEHDPCSPVNIEEHWIPVVVKAELYNTETLEDKDVEIRDFAVVYTCQDGSWDEEDEKEAVIELIISWMEQNDFDLTIWGINDFEYRHGVYDKKEKKIY